MESDSCDCCRPDSSYRSPPPSEIPLGPSGLPRLWEKTPDSTPTYRAPKESETERYYIGSGKTRPRPKDILREVGPYWDTGVYYDSEDGLFRREVSTKKTHRVEIPSGIYRQEVDQYRPDKYFQTFLRQDRAFHLGSVQDFLFDDVRKFLSNRPLYQSLGIKYKRGVLLFGAPGNGKTTLIRTLLREISSNPSLILFVDKVPDPSSLRSFSLDPRLKVFVFEEFTTAISNSTETTRILDFLDGEASIDHCLILATTNYAAELPANIVRRPSRMDLVLNVSDPNEGIRSLVISETLGRTPSSQEVKATEGLSVAAVREVCLRSILQGHSLPDVVEEFNRRAAAASRDFGTPTSTRVGF